MTSERRRFVLGASAVRRDILALLGVCLALVVAPAGADERLFDARGFATFRPTVSQLPFEHVDPLTGNLMLATDDLVLPGNAGLDLRIRRSYNSKFFPPCQQGQTCQFIPERSWAGIGWAMHFGRIHIPPFPQPFRPVIEMPDGSLHRTYATANGLMTQEYWVYSSDAAGNPLVSFPDGTVYRFTTRNWAGPSGSLYVDQIQDPFGNRIAIEYEPAGPADAIRSITQYLGGATRTITFTTDSNGLLATMTYAGRTWVYSHVGTGVNGYGLLTRVQPPAGGAWDYTYELSAPIKYELKGWTTPHGGTASYTYGTQWFEIGTYLGTYSRVVTRRTTGGRGVPAGSWTYAYGQGVDRNQTVVTAPCDTTTYTFAGVGAWATSNIPVWKIGLVERIATGTLQSEVFEWRASDAFSWDLNQVAAHYDVQTWVPLLARRTLVREGHTYATSYTYGATNFNDYGRPTQIDEAGDLTRRTHRTFIYGFTPYIRDKVATETVTIGNSSVATAFAYDATTGFVRSQTIAGVTTTFQPDSAGNVARRTDADGRWTTYTYESGVLSTTGTALYTITRRVNPDGTIASLTRGGSTTTYAYDALGRVLTVDPPLGNRTSFAYSSTGASMSRTRGGATLTADLDGFGRVVGTSDAAGVQTERRFDACGRETYVSYPFTGTSLGTAFEYDDLSRVRRRVYPDGNAVTLVYDGVRVDVADEEQRHTVFGYQAFGSPEDARLTTVQDAAGHVTTYTYNAAGSLTSTAGPVAGTRSWTYNARNQLSLEVQPERGQTVYWRDETGHMISKQDAEQRTIAYQYDSNGRLVRIMPSLGSAIDISYDDWDRRATVTEAGLSTADQYDAAGRLTRHAVTVQGTVFATEYGYDGNDNLVSVRYPSGRMLALSYDSANRLTRVGDAALGTAYASSLTYHPSGALASYVAGNALTHTVTYNNRYWPATINAGGAVHLTYTYRAAGDIASITEASRSGMNQVFGYDGLGRLTSATGPWGSAGFTYDAAGDRTTKSVGVQSSTYQYDIARRLRSVGGAEAASFDYDRNGNVTRAGGLTLGYNAFDMATSATMGGLVTSYQYDLDQWRVRKVGSSGTRYFVRDPSGQLLAEYEQTCSGAPQLVKEYVYAGTRLLASIRPAGRVITLSLAAQVSVSESAGSGTTPVQLTTSDGQPIVCPVSVEYRTVAGTATSDADFTATTGVLTFEAGTSSGTTRAIVVPILNDPRYEGEERFTLQLANPANATLGQGSQTVTIVDDESPPAITVSNVLFVTEPIRGVKDLSVTVTVMGLTDRPVTVTYSTADRGQATAGVDYLPRSGTLSIPPGETSATIVVPVLGDLVVEGSEEFAVVLSNAVDGWLMVPTGIVTILNNFLAGRTALGDFDGDGRADITVFRPSTGLWYMLLSGGGSTSVVWGGGDDLPAPGDYDGDGRMDVAVFRPSNGTWYIRHSTGTGATLPFGVADDVPVPGDYDDDGLWDVAVFRPSTGTWYIRHTATGLVTTAVWGGPGDQAVVSDYNADRKTDIAVYRPSNGTWYVHTGSGSTGALWGFPSDVPVPGDYDGDGRGDFGVFRPSTGEWLIVTAAGGTVTGVLGGGADRPVPGDYDGDGRTDFAVFRPSDGTWSVRQSSTGSTTTATWGGSIDRPILGR